MSSGEKFAMVLMIGALVFGLASFFVDAGGQPPTAFPTDCADPVIVGTMLREPGDPEFRSTVKFPDYTTHERMAIYRCASGYAWFGPVEMVEHAKK